MGKKPSAKKKGKVLDLRGYATASVASIRKDADKEAEEAPAAEEEAEGPSPQDDPKAAASRSGGDAGNEPECEDWERLDQEPANPSGESQKAAPEELPTDRNAGGIADEEEWEKAVESRLDEELQRLEKRFIPADATAQLERKGGASPAGVVVLNKRAEQLVEAALAPLRGEDGDVRPTFPRSWRYKGKLTYERLNGIYLALESLHFKGEQIRWAMEKALGYDVRAPLELLLVSLPKEELPRQFGGDSLGDDPNAMAEVTAGGNNQQQEVSDAKAEAEASKNVTPAEQTTQKFEPPARTDPQPTEATPAKQDDKGKEFTKSWMMQYCQGGGSDSDELLDEAEKLDRERKANPTARYLKISRQFDELTKACKALKEKKKHGSFKQNISADMQKQKDASTRMAAIKTEMEELERGKYGKLDRSKIDAELAALQKQKAEPAPPTPAPAGDSAEASNEAAAGGAGEEGKEPDAGEEGAELPSLFDGDEGPEAGAGDGAAEAAAALPPLRAYNIAGWNGKTPKQFLEDFIRKRIWGKSGPSGSVASYERVQPRVGNRHRARVTVQLPKGRGSPTFDPEEACETVRDAENLAAAWALRKLAEEADRPGLGRTLPPTFRQRWVEWDQEANSRLREAQRGRAKGRIAFLERMLRTKPPAQAFGQAGGLSQEAAGGKLWAEAGEDAQFIELSGDAASQIRADFDRRQQALSGNRDFQEIQKVRAGLPVAEYRESMLHFLQKNNVMVVSGATGSGKTTQVPQYVLEDALLQPDSGGPLPSIIVTEPRRISAVSVAKRVSQELGDPKGGPGSRGSLVGYQIRLEKRTTDTTRLLFCTVGVLLKQMQQGLSVLSRVTHIFIDEIHERSADCDLLLLLLRQIRNQKPDLRIVLMSATMEVDKLVRYFGNNVPVMSVPGRTFPVKTFWMEDIVEMTGYRCDDESEFVKRGWNAGWSRRETFQVSGQKGKTEKLTAYIDDDDDWAADDEAECCDPTRYCDETSRTLAKMDHTRINYDLIEATLELIEGSPEFRSVPRDEGAVLIFLPGIMEITKVNERLSRSPQFGDPSKCLLLSLHSVLSGDEHAKAFERPRKGVRKIVLSTNIAETGVTIPDVVFVVDAGKVKSQRYHEPSNTSSLKEMFISRAEVLQRRGRAGRVREGFAFHLVTHSRFSLRFQEVPTPEILRCSLMELMLSVLSSGLQPACFSEALDPPPKTRIDQAITTLKATGAVEEGPRPVNAPQWGTSDDAWYVTTPVGQCLARLPCDVRLGKMVLFAALFGGVDAVWTVAATLSHRSPFVTPFSDAKKATARNVQLAEFVTKEMAPSDHFALHTAFVRWDDARKGRIADSFCRKNWLNNQVMQTIRDIRKDFLDSLKSDGFCEKYTPGEVPTQEIQSQQLIAALIFAGLYPNVARVDSPKSASEKFPALSAGSEQLKLHPGSLCHGRIEGLHRTNHRWICYHEKVKTSQVFLRDCTFLTPNALLMFGGDTSSLTIHPVEKSISIGTGGERHWHTLYVNPRFVALLRQLRYLFEGLLRRKAMDPRQHLCAADRAVISAYTQGSLSNEEEPDQNSAASGGNEEPDQNSAVSGGNEDDPSHCSETSPSPSCHDQSAGSLGTASKSKQEAAESVSAELSQDGASSKCSRHDDSHPGASDNNGVPDGFISLNIDHA